MVNPKFIIISTVIGFVLSFFIGIISGIGFGTVVIRALIFGVVFAVLSEGIYVLYVKFLDDGSSPSAPEVEHASVRKSKPGEVLNITVGDEQLSDEEGAPKFEVTQSQTARNDSPVPEPVKASVSVKTPEIVPVQEAVSQDTPVAASVKTPENNNDFKPVVLGTQVNESSPSETQKQVDQNPDSVSSESASPVSAAESKPASPGAEQEQLDELPDLSDVTFSEKKADSDDIISDSDFASGPKSRSSGSAASGSSGDSALMAQAIRTLLAKD